MKTLLIVIALSIAAAGQETVYTPGNGVRLPKVVKQVKATYTQEAKDAHIEGTVELSTVVLADGTVGAVKVTRSLDTTYGLDEEAIKAMKQWIFEPGTKDGKAVAVRVSVNLTFTLK